MTTTVVALYDRLDEAHRAAEALDAAGVPPDAVSLVTGDGASPAGGIAGVLSGCGMPEPEMRRYAESVRRGGAVLLAFTADDRTDQVRRILSRRARAGGTRRAAEAAARIEGGGNAVRSEAESRGADWRTAGWAPFDQRPGPMTEGHREAGARSAGGLAPDCTDFGQPGSSPGTRGGATSFGGVERVPRAKGNETKKGP